VTGTDVDQTLEQLVMAGIATADLELVHASKAGDINAFDELVRRYDRKLLRIAQHVTNNREDAEDVVQESFLKAFQYLNQFRETSQFSTWLYRIALNESLLKLRRRRTSREVSIDKDFQSEDDLPIDVVDWAPNPEQLYETSQLRDILRTTLQGLRPSLRVVYVLRDIEMLSLQETAEALQLSVSAVKARLWRARMQLRELLTAYFRGERASAEAEPCCNNAESA
jgi:RNA polymerase sigma-70 factor (ECF subfamily)